MGLETMLIGAGISAVVAEKQRKEASKAAAASKRDMTMGPPSEVRPIEPVRKEKKYKPAQFVSDDDLKLGIAGKLG